MVRVKYSYVYVYKLFLTLISFQTFISYVGRTINWIFSSIFVLFLGSLITVGICSYTNLCTIDFHGVGPIHEEMRAMVSSERLEKISNAADFVKNAIDKYQKIQKVTGNNSVRRRRNVFYWEICLQIKCLKVLTEHIKLMTIKYFCFTYFIQRPSYF